MWMNEEYMNERRMNEWMNESNLRMPSSMSTAVGIFQETAIAIALAGVVNVSDDGQSLKVGAWLGSSILIKLN